LCDYCDSQNHRYNIDFAKVDERNFTNIGERHVLEFEVLYKYDTLCLDDVRIEVSSLTFHLGLQKKERTHFRKSFLKYDLKELSFFFLL
jgi:hypothetical protein